jgi:hypothetical protein
MNIFKRKNMSNKELSCQTCIQKEEGGRYSYNPQERVWLCKRYGIVIDEYINSGLKYSGCTMENNN